VLRIEEAEDTMLPARDNEPEGERLPTCNCAGAMLLPSVGAKLGADLLFDNVIDPTDTKFTGLIIIVRGLS